MDKIDGYLYNIDMEFTDIHVRRAEKTYCSPAWHWKNPVPFFDGYLFWIILDGRGTLTTERAVYDISRGDAFLMRMWEHLEGTHDTEHTLVVPWIHFECAGPSPRLKEHPPEHMRIENITFIAELADRVVRRLREGRHAEADLWMKAILSELLNAGAPYNDPWIPRIDAVRSRIHDDPASFSIADAAREQRCTEDHLIRVFKRIAGTTPVDYLVRVRIERAKDMLLYASQSIEEIALELGYADIYYFSRQFKERTGMPPSVFRRSGNATR